MPYPDSHEGNRDLQLRVCLFVCSGNKPDRPDAAEVGVTQAYKLVTGDEARSLSPSSGPELTHSRIFSGILWLGHDNRDPRESATCDLTYVQRKTSQPQRNKNNEQCLIKCV